MISLIYNDKLEHIVGYTFPLSQDFWEGWDSDADIAYALQLPEEEKDKYRVRTPSHILKSDFNPVPKYIDDDAFFNCEELLSIEIPEGVEYIGRCAFEACENLVWVSLPSTIKEIGRGAFEDCVNLKEVHFQDGITEISGHNLFKGCDNLTILSFPASVIRIGGFNDIQNLEIVYAHYVKQIFNYAFSGCLNLKTFKADCDYDLSIGDYAFEGCKKLEDIGFFYGHEDDTVFNGCSRLRNVKLSDFTDQISCDNYTKLCDTSEEIKTPVSVIEVENKDQAIINYEENNTEHLLLYAQCLINLQLDINRVVEIRLIGTYSKETIEQVQRTYPHAKIVVIEKQIHELNDDDVRCQHSLVLHLFAKTFIKDRIISKSIDSDHKYYTYPIRKNLEVLAEKIAKTRFKYDIISYECGRGLINADRDMYRFHKILTPDTILNSHYDTYILAHLYNCPTENCVNGNKPFNSKIDFVTTMFEGNSEAWYYDKPLEEETKYLDSLSRSSCDLLSGFLRMVPVSPYNIARTFEVNGFQWLRCYSYDDTVKKY